MNERKGLITAAEHMALLQKDPEWVARHAAREAARLRREQELQREEGQLLFDLMSIGIQVESVWDFVNTADKYPAAIPVLLRHLAMPYSKRTLEGIVRAPTVNYAAPEVLRGLIKQFREQIADSSNSLKCVLSNAISDVATPADSETMEGLATDL